MNAYHFKYMENKEQYNQKLKLTRNPTNSQ